MYLPETLGARRICYLAGRPYWVRPIDMGGIADVLAWLEDMVPGEREGPPAIGDPESRAALDSVPGEVLMAWIGLRDQGVGYEEAAGLWLRADEEERARFLRSLFHRRPTLQLSAGGEDSGRMWCGEGIAQAMADMGVDAFRSLTLDQLEFLNSGGKCDGHADPSHKALMEVQRIWEEQQAAGAAGTNGEATT